ncbi:MAG: hypothetical protein ND807_02330 [Vicinamibacterales bacterium]|nr:hypothetical protein [Vicinamibacterales bacterium]
MKPAAPSAPPYRRSKRSSLDGDTMKIAGPAVAAVCATLSFWLPGEAHKGITSKFTYNADVYPIFLNRCGHCHVAGGVGPMSLLSYEDAFPWAESLRAELLETEGATADDPAGFIAAAHRNAPARELDVILDWAGGGTPEGDPAMAPRPVALRNEWTHGEPQLALPLGAPYQMPPDAMEAIQEFTWPLALSTAREANAIDVLPGTPAIVREVDLLLRTGTAAPRPLGTWIPKQNPAPLVLSPPARLEPGSTLVARVHYRKTWKYEGQPMTDRSTIGVYFLR